MKNTYRLIKKIALTGCLLGICVSGSVWGAPQKSALPAHSDSSTEQSNNHTISISGYVLALQWSPEYCRGKTTKAADAYQCGSGRFFGFISEGLWPEDAQQKRLQSCKDATPLSPAMVDKMADITPSAQLLQQQWAKYGVCVAPKPEEYFSRTTTLFRKIHLPDMNKLSSDPDLTIARVKDAFLEANHHLNANAIKIAVNRKNWLTGIRICYNSDFKFQDCAVDSSALPAEMKIKIKPGFQLRPVFG
ncbi:MAG: ribonuclease I [Zymomonas mobilis]|uniref:Ribonuclease T2 n=1 Tax=Zymomonas mobilis TaxID=542 RepID=A0A542VYV9_ZYMMB|nr:ribonuclease I [Zymomonas mobilis]TQL16483.1 ribonuclease T2 [Zymomonas mobilis]